ncbi:hypothetical protein [Rhizobium lentis]|uniref:UvrD-like helicase C-terminal domain-containing protein n=1 Tax=Rhizobium lentis TaxID=1138194 RepID=A0A7W8XHS5_9HYPH|nr:hypothetical protein [Rhizobium lentis]MBB4576552.1 hypothetical protein [Rhizobium lentis]MBB5552583.1 hypothetical protein [Rhizobium lentis]MBB5563122.1 hypothetical protein [Rhizobium lentis]MBB5569400.1 hypothetical protein [Rhizobium lentis]
MSFKTIHASRGLEAAHVILLNADSRPGGFPSETVDDPLLILVSPDEEGFEYAGERRVMFLILSSSDITSFQSWASIRDLRVAPSFRHE